MSVPSQRSINWPIASLFILGLAIVVALIAPPRGSDSASDDGSTLPDRARSSRAQSDQPGGVRSKRRSRASIQSRERLLALIDCPPEEAPDFGEIDRLVSRLSDRELWELIETSKHQAALSVGGWVRSAAFTELGRRDGPGLLDRLVADQFGKDSPELGPPAFYSLFRGWGERDPQAAFEKLMALPHLYDVLEPEPSKTTIGMEQWRSEAFTEIAASWIRLDPDAALISLRLHDAYPDYRPATWEGILRATEDPTQLKSRLHEWAAVAGQLRAGRSFNISLEQSSFDPSPSTLRLRVADDLEVRLTTGMGALNLGSHGLEEAAHWLENEGPKGIPNRTGLVQHMLNHHAQRQPDEALRMLQNGHEHAAFIGGGIIWANPERALEVVEAMKGQAELGDALYYGINQQGQPRAQWNYPAPDRVNRLDDWDNRYQLLEAALDAADLPEERRSQLQKQLGEEFHFAPTPHRTADEGPAAP